MNKLKTVCIILVKILIICLLVLTFNLVMMPKYINENHDGRIIAELYKEKSPLDVIFLGSSTVYSGITPCVLYENYGITSYVCASSSQASWESYYVLLEALKKANPKLVVLDIGFMTIGDEYAEEVSNRKLFDYMRPSKNKYDAIKEAMADGENMWDYVLPVLRYHSRYNDLTVDDFKYAFYKPQVTYNGYVMSTLISEDIPERVTMDMAETKSLSPRNAKYLQQIISECTSRGIDIMLVKTPSLSAKWDMSYEMAIANIAAINNIAYVNFDSYQDVMGFDWHIDSNDGGGHLNLFGAEKYTYYLGSVVKGYYELPDRRLDNDINEIWIDKLNRYNNDKVMRLYNGL